MEALDCLGRRGPDLAMVYRLEFNAQAVESARALRFRMMRAGADRADALRIVALVGGASSGKSTLFNNLLGGRAASRVSARGHSTRGPILAAHDERRDALEGLLGAGGLLPGAARREIGLDARDEGAVDALCLAYHGCDALRDVLLMDMPDFTSELARMEGDLTLSLLPWFDRLVVLVDHERLFDRQTVQRMREESGRFGQERIVVFNRVAQSRLSDAERERLARQAERLRAAEYHVIDDRPGRGLCLIPPDMLAPILQAIGRPVADRQVALLRFLGECASRALNQNALRARLLDDLAEAIRRSVGRALPSRFECLSALMMPEERRHLDVVWRTIRWRDTRQWIQARVHRIGSALRRAVPLVGPLLAPPEPPAVEESIDTCDRQALGWALFERTSRRQKAAAVQAAAQSAFWEEVHRWTNLDPRSMAHSSMDEAPGDDCRERVAARVDAVASALAQWRERVERECAGVAPNVVGALGGGALAGFIVLAAVAGPIGALTWGAAKAAIVGGLGTLAASAGVGAAAAKPVGRLVSVVQERLLGSPEFNAVQNAAQEFVATAAAHGDAIAEATLAAARKLVLPGESALTAALTEVADAAEGKP